MSGFSGGVSRGEKLWSHPNLGGEIKISIHELQYGFKISAIDQVSDQVTKMNSHIRAFTSHNLSHETDSLKAILEITARYSTDNALCLLLGMPVWARSFADAKSALPHIFALSVSTWTHAAAPQVAKDAEMYVTDCPRRDRFPSST